MIKNFITLTSKDEQAYTTFETFISPIPKACSLKSSLPPPHSQITSIKSEMKFLGNRRNDGMRIEQNKTQIFNVPQKEFSVKDNVNTRDVSRNLKVASLDT